mmetsp:Transcript_16651/g.24862  ORF Transcript_16651/g.24862 Transcript_16651/m.24862 type:complete len:203 (-) Transcript_16651:1551-2159(-)
MMVAMSIAKRSACTSTKTSLKGDIHWIWIVKTVDLKFAIGHILHNIAQHLPRFFGRCQISTTISSLWQIDGKFSVEHRHGIEKLAPVNCIWNVGNNSLWLFVGAQHLQLKHTICCLQVFWRQLVEKIMWERPTCLIRRDDWIDVTSNTRLDPLRKRVPQHLERTMLDWTVGKVPYLDPHLFIEWKPEKFHIMRAFNHFFVQW